MAQTFIFGDSFGDYNGYLKNFNTDKLEWTWFYKLMSDGFVKPENNFSKSGHGPQQLWDSFYEHSSKINEGDNLIFFYSDPKRVEWDFRFFKGRMRNEYTPNFLFSTLRLEDPDNLVNYQIEDGLPSENVPLSKDDLFDQNLIKFFYDSNLTRFKTSIFNDLTTLYYFAKVKRYNVLVFFSIVNFKKYLDILQFDELKNFYVLPESLYIHSMYDHDMNKKDKKLRAMHFSPEMHDEMYEIITGFFQRNEKLTFKNKFSQYYDADNFLKEFIYE